MSGFLNWFQHIPEHVLALDPVWLLVVCGLLVFAEDAVFVGFVIPGESAAVVAGVASSIGHVPFPAAIVVVVLAAVIGDTVGYEVGRHLVGPKVLESRLLARHAARIEKASEFLRRRGGVAVFLGRFTAFFRAVMPALAGSARMPYLRFLKWNAVGGIVWGTGFVVLGHVAGSSYQQVASRAGHWAAIGFVAAVVLLVIGWRVREHRRG
ncbi:DedA family protein [Nocardioides terrisoli]|uniref:DedA family protein n=1 Tax=Nocardioides terrisoli TaxID=3388267 RepID=UPI00287B5E44|nr:DedA family protein [Nocardioides marmorisolisilvae]